MKSMTEHAAGLEWAAGWFKRISYIAVAVAILMGILLVLFLFSGRSTPRYSTPALSATDTIVTLIGSLSSAFLFRAGFIICSFLSDFASGLAAQQIRRERQNQNPDR